MVELAVTLVLISGMVVAFQAVPRGQGAASDRTAQGRIDTVANAIYNAYRPGVSTADLTAEELANYTSSPIVDGAIDRADRRQVSLAFGDGGENRPAGYFGLAALGRPGTCWYMKGRIGLTGTAGTALQTAWYSYTDFPDDSSEDADVAAALWCTGTVALSLTEGGASWQQFTFADVLDTP
jgi:hypothetical protein